jgi:hypothetical protein
MQQGVTIARTHLRIVVTNTTAPAGGNSFYVGLIRGQNTDVGVNVAGAPNPATAPYEDWLLWDHVVADGSGNFDAYGGTQLHYDLKAMRKLSELQMNYNIVMEAPAWSAFPLVAVITGRILLLLP